MKTDRQASPHLSRGNQKAALRSRRAGLLMLAGVSFDAIRVGFSVGAHVPVRVESPSMERYEHKGYEIFLMRRQWEVFDAGGDLVAEGSGGVDEACAWIDEQDRAIADLASALKPTRH